MTGPVPIHHGIGVALAETRAVGQASRCFQDCTDSSEVLAPCEEGERCLLAAALLTGGDLLNQIWKKKKMFFPFKLT